MIGTIQRIRLIEASSLLVRPSRERLGRVSVTAVVAVTVVVAVVVFEGNALSTAWGPTTFGYLATVIAVAAVWTAALAGPRSSAAASRFAQFPAAGFTIGTGVAVAQAWGRGIVLTTVLALVGWFGFVNHSALFWAGVAALWLLLTLASASATNFGSLRPDAPARRQRALVWAGAVALIAAGLLVTRFAPLPDWVDSWYSSAIVRVLAGPALMLTPIGGEVTLLGTAVWCLVALVVYIVSVRATLTRRPRPLEASEASLAWFGVLRGRGALTVAARTLTYWSRDPRYRVVLLSIPILPLVLLPLAWVLPTPALLWLLVPPLLALFFGWQLHNDVALDSTAFWIHVASGIRASSDRWGRLVPSLVLVVLVIALTSPIASVLAGRADLTPGVAGLASAIGLTALGVSSIMNVLSPYPTSLPQHSAFAVPAYARSSAAFVQPFVLVFSLAGAIPTVLAYLINWDAWRLFGVGVGTGVIVLLVTVLVSQGIYRARVSRLLESAVAAG